jgi:NAD(P)-dependent dehydrogenase (short-subunit alcohol dehydrogenase family)
MDNTLNAKRVVIIGGSSGIGLETARMALAAGAFVTIAGRSQNRLRKAAEVLEKADRLRLVVADMSDGVSIQVDHIFVPAGELRPDGADLLTSDIGVMRSGSAAAGISARYPTSEGQN